MSDRACPVHNCQIPVDVVLRSCNGHLIGAHRSNLDNYSDGFPPPDATSDSSQPFDLTETGGTLERLMQYMHKQNYPDISFLNGEGFVQLADAAAKYMVYPAIGVCYTRLLYDKETANNHPKQALAYAYKFNQPKIADIVAPCTLFDGIEEMRSALNDDGALYAWLQYKTSYMEALNVIVGWKMLWSQDSYYHCPSWQSYRLKALSSFVAFIHESQVNWAIRKVAGNTGLEIPTWPAEER